MAAGEIRKVSPRGSLPGFSAQLESLREPFEELSERSMTEVNYHLARLSEAAIAHRPPPIHRQQVRMAGKRRRHGGLRRAGRTPSSPPRTPVASALFQTD